MRMKKEEILEKHSKWLRGERGGERADLREADLREADLRGADLREADLDFSCLPLWCGALGMVVDNRLQYQFLYHAYRQNNPDQDPDLQELFASEMFRRCVAKFHRFNESGGFLEELEGE